MIWGKTTHRSRGRDERTAGRCGVTEPLRLVRESSRRSVPRAREEPCVASRDGLGFASNLTRAPLRAAVPTYRPSALRPSLAEPDGSGLGLRAGNDEGRVHIDVGAREITVKLVYYGPALSGKTTNLQALHRAAAPGSAGRLMTLETRDDRTLFFDLLPLSFRDQAVAVRLKVFTVPGQVIHSSTRRLVVQGADGIVFVADSRVAETENNAESFLDLRRNLKDQAMDVHRMPVVIQFNKRDLPDVRSDEDIAALASQGREPVYASVATLGIGVVETFMGVLELTCRGLELEHGLVQKFGFRYDQFLSNVAEKLGQTRLVADLVASRLGGGGFQTPYGSRTP